MTNREQLEEEKLRLIKCQADKIEIENAKTLGELVEAKTVLRTWGDYVVSCKAKLLGIPSKVAQELSSIEDPNTIKEVLTDYIIECLEELDGEKIN